jgi:hypothetical protein
MKEVANTNNPIDMLFGGMEKLAPGGNVHTLNLLRLLPRQQFQIVYDVDVLEPRAQALVGDPDSSVSDLAIETLQEIEIFNIAEASYGYVFYVLERI